MPKITVPMTTAPRSWAPNWPTSPLMMPSTPAESRPVPAGAVPAVGEDARRRARRSSRRRRARSIAPTGSSTLSFRSMKNTASMTRTPAMQPMTAAAHGATKAHGAVMATRPASMPLAIMPGSGLPVRNMIQNIATIAPKAPAMAVLVATTANWTSVAAKRRGGVEAEPAEQQDERPEHGHRDVVAGQRLGRAVLGVLADAGPEHDRPGQRGDAADHVHDAGAGEVDVAGAEAHRVPDLGQPAAAPRPRREQRVVDRAAEEAPADEGCSTSTARPSPRSGSWPRCP